MTAYIPARGDLVWLTSTPQVGREQAGRRPAVVLSPLAYNHRVGLALFCPITSQQKGYPFEVVLPSALPITGVILTDQIKSLDWRICQASYIGTLAQEMMVRILQRVHTLVAIDPPYPKASTTNNPM